MLGNPIKRDPAIYAEREKQRIKVRSNFGNFLTQQGEMPCVRLIKAAIKLLFQAQDTGSIRNIRITLNKSFKAFHR